MSYGPLQYNRAQERLDDQIKILEWIVSEYVSVLVPYRDLQPAHDQVIQTNTHYNQVRAAKELLAHAYNLHLFQTAEHPNDCVCPCCKHYFRETFQTNTIYKQHWYRWEGPQQDIPIGLLDDHRLLNSRAKYIDNVINDVCFLGIFIERNFQAHPTVQIQVYILMDNVNLKIPILHWLKCHDHVSENIWQKLLCYLCVLYFSLDQIIIKLISRVFRCLRI